MSTNERDETTAPLSREELIALVGRAHLGSASADDQRAGATLAAHSRLPRRVAQNLGAGFGQWDFFPEIPDIVDFALAYVPPATEEELWALARRWAADDAASRPTLMTLVGRDILDQELRRIDVPSLRELVDEPRPARARELRTKLGLDVPPPRRRSRPQPPGARREPRRAHRRRRSASYPRECPSPSSGRRRSQPPRPSPGATGTRSSGTACSAPRTAPARRRSSRSNSRPARRLLARYVTELLP